MSGGDRGTVPACIWLSDILRDFLAPPVLHSFCLRSCTMGLEFLSTRLPLMR